MVNLLRSLKRRLLNLYYRRNYYVSKIFRPSVPATFLHYLPHGFTVHAAGNTGLRVVDNFCTGEEASYLIELARAQLYERKVIIGGRPVEDSGNSSSHAVVFHRHHQDNRLLPIVARGAMLAGVPTDHAEQVYVSRYADGDFYNGHYDFADGFLTDHRLCTMLVYLNNLAPEQGGATYFKDLNIAVQPKMGRALIWTNMNPDGTKHLETLHAALPPRGEGTEKWAIHLWFRPYRMYPIRKPLQSLQTNPGIPLSGNDTLPSGTWIPAKSA